MRCVRLGAAIAVIGVAAACSEPPVEPSMPLAAALAKGGAAACPTPADVVVTDEVGLLAALSAASPGDVIGLDGLIELTTTLILTTDDLTLTCATAGSGLAAQSGPVVADLIYATAKGVTVERLVLDGSEASDGVVSADNNGATSFAEDFRLTNNTVICGPFFCALFAGVKGAIIADNYFETAGSATGVHIQGHGSPLTTRPSDGTRVERNTIVATGPRPFASPWLGGIRARDGANLVISRNVVVGPWRHSLSPAELATSVVEKNQLEGAREFGIRLSANFDPASAISMRDNTFRNNRVTAAGTAGIFATRACGNVFFGNNLQGNAGNMGLIFDISSGANTLVGNQNVVVDNGAFDCNGDLVNDPNIITGRGAVLHGVNLGDIVSDAATGSNRLR